MKELTVISGKGGTGKTTITGSFASLAENAILADCDIDAPDLELISSPEVMDEEKYVGTFTAKKIKDCSLCGKCKESCRFNAINEDIEIKELKCEGCGVCEFVFELLDLVFQIVDFGLFCCEFLLEVLDFCIVFGYFLF